MLWEIFFTKKYHHVVGNHVMGIHVKWGTAVCNKGLNADLAKLKST